jgi:hypothetical protein
VLQTLSARPSRPAYGSTIVQVNIYNITRKNVNSTVPCFVKVFAVSSARRIGGPPD